MRSFIFFIVDKIPNCRKQSGFKTCFFEQLNAVARTARSIYEVLFMNGKEETGLFGINIHRASQTGTTTYVDKYSAGCQVFSNADDFNVFMQLCDRHRQYYGNDFTYTLIDERALVRESKKN